MKEDLEEKTEEVQKTSRFKIQFKKYWSYTRKWFPFSFLIGIISGIIMGLFTSLIVNLQMWLDFIPVYIKYPIVGGITSLMLYFGFKEVSGAGISYVLKHKNTTTAIPSRAIITKFLMSALTLGVAAPAGREGPSVTIGSTVAFTVADKLKMSKEDEMHAVTIGAAACTAAVFKTPLGGTVFASEVPYKHDLDETVFLPALVASAISMLVSEGILYLLKSVPVYLDVETVSAPFKLYYSLIFILLGIFAGFSGIAFSLLFKNFSKWSSKFIKPFLLPALGMVLTTIIVVICERYFLPENITLGGTGFHSINALLENYQSISIAVLFVLFIGKMVATSTCVGFGASGGVMGPSLVTGAALGALYSKIFPFIDPIILIIIGMSALHTATTKTPIASMLIVLEMVGFPSLVIPIILSNASAFIISMDFSLYSGQIQSKEVILRRTIQYTDLLETISVKTSMKKVFPTVNQNETLSETFSLLYLHKTSSIIVLDDEGKLSGMISAVDFQEGFAKGKTFIHEAMTSNVITAYPDEKLNSVFDRLTENSIECMPVVDRDEPSKTIGIISFSDIENSYETELTKLQSRRQITMEEIENDI